MKKMSVDKLGIDLLTHDPVVILRDLEGRKYLPILIGPFEATAIALALEGASVPRPLSHDLMVSIISALGAKVQSVQIHDIQNNTFYAKIIIEKDGKTSEIDARPSDSIALALRTKAPIYVEDRIIMEESVIAKKASGQQEGRDIDIEGHDKQMLRKYIDNLKPSDFLKGFDNGGPEKISQDDNEK